MRDRQNTMDSNVVVDVESEPNHVEIFRNEFLRAYIAAIAPGKETLFHRHSRDTLYVILEGGRTATIPLKGRGTGSYVFPRSFPKTRIVRWGLQRILCGSIQMPTGAHFLQLCRGIPQIHTVRASLRNTTAVRMMGVELIRRAVSPCKGVPAGDEIEYADSDFEVRRLELPTERKAVHIAALPCLLIAVKGRASVYAEQEDCGGEVSSIAAGEVVWINRGRRRRISLDPECKFGFLGLAIHPREAWSRA